jgi:hypothetical protein
MTINYQNTTVIYISETSSALNTGVDQTMGSCQNVLMATVTKLDRILYLAVLV